MFKSTPRAKRSGLTAFQTDATFPNTLDNSHHTPTDPIAAGMPNLIQ